MNDMFVSLTRVMLFLATLWIIPSTIKVIGNYRRTRGMASVLVYTLHAWVEDVGKSAATGFRLRIMWIKVGRWQGCWGRASPIDHAHIVPATSVYFMLLYIRIYVTSRSFLSCCCSMSLQSSLWTMKLHRPAWRFTKDSFAVSVRR
jgi:hypothetical protein